jgi:hypothetical protein
MIDLLCCAPHLAGDALPGPQREVQQPIIKQRVRAYLQQQQQQRQQQQQQQETAQVSS